MAKSTTRSKSVKTLLGKGAKGRDTELPITPVLVSGDEQAKFMDTNTERQFGLSRMERNNLPERPSTSGGPTSKRRNADKRETKDDLSFNPSRAYGSGTTFYNFPLPGSLSAPGRSVPTQEFKFPRSDTSSSMDATGTLRGPRMEIGMALGSPTHQQMDWRSQAPTISGSKFDTTDSGGSSFENDSYIAAPSRQKASKWKIFGGLFVGNKRNAASPQAFYQLQPEGAVVQTTVETACTESGEPIKSSMKRTKTRGRKNDRRKPSVKGLQTGPLNFDFQASGGGKAAAGAPAVTLDGTPLKVHYDKIQANGGPLLSVEIPSVQMERYSVMFGSLLQNNGSSSSSLLARRQATLDRFKIANEELDLKERELEAKAHQLSPRRATSPQPTRSPALSLFPNTPSRLVVRERSPSPNGRSLQRSNTSPAALSPSRAVFAPEEEKEAQVIVMAPGPHVPLAPEPQDVGIRNKDRGVKDIQQIAEPSSKSQPSTQMWSPEESHLSLDSPVNDIEVEQPQIYNSASVPTKPKVDEPNRQVITSHHNPVPSGSGFGSGSGSGSSTSSPDQSSSTSASSISTTSIVPLAMSNINTVKIQAPPPRLRSRTGTTTTITAQPRRKGQEVTPTTSSKIPVARIQRQASEPSLVSASTPPITQSRRKASEPSLISPPNPPINQARRKASEPSLISPPNPPINQARWKASEPSLISPPNPPINQARWKASESPLAFSTAPSIAHSRRKASEPSPASSPAPITLLPSSAVSAPKKSLAIKTTPAELEPAEEDLEKRLKKAADVSIARQISISRQQRQLLMPVRTSSNPNHSTKYNQNYPLPLNISNMNHVASPLGAVVVESPVDRDGWPMAERKGLKAHANRERLVASEVKPSTPTLIVVGYGEREKEWAGKARQATEHRERRTGERGAAAVVGNERRTRRRLSPGEVQQHHYRKSESIVVERVSVASSS